jgi:hypothetical protein
MPLPVSNAERAIADVLLAKWDPLRVRDTPGTHEEYLPHAHAVYGLLARGASMLQVSRYLHRIEGEEMHHPELAAEDLTPLLDALRAIDLDG